MPSEGKRAPSPLAKCWYAVQKPGRDIRCRVPRSIHDNIQDHPFTEGQRMVLEDGTIRTYKTHIPYAELGLPYCGRLEVWEILPNTNSIPIISRAKKNHICWTCYRFWVFTRERDRMLFRSTAKALAG